MGLVPLAIRALRERRALVASREHEGARALVSLSRPAVETRAAPARSTAGRYGAFGASQAADHRSFGGGIGTADGRGRGARCSGALERGGRSGQRGTSRVGAGLATVTAVTVTVTVAPRLAALYHCAVDGGGPSGAASGASGGGAAASIPKVEQAVTATRTTSTMAALSTR